MVNLAKEKCRKNAKKYGVICRCCRSTFVAPLLKKTLFEKPKYEFCCYRKFFDFFALDRSYERKKYLNMTTKI